MFAADKSWATLQTVGLEVRRYTRNYARRKSGPAFGGKACFEIGFQVSAVHILAQFDVAAGKAFFQIRSKTTRTGIEEVRRSTSGNLRHRAICVVGNPVIGYPATYIGVMAEALMVKDPHLQFA